MKKFFFCCWYRVVLKPWGIPRIFFAVGKVLSTLRVGGVSAVNSINILPPFHSLFCTMHCNSDSFFWTGSIAEKSGMEKTQNKLFKVNYPLVLNANNIHVGINLLFNLTLLTQKYYFITLWQFTLLMIIIIILNYINNIFIPYFQDLSFGK